MHKLRKNNHHYGVYTFRAFQNITRQIITNNGLLSLTDNIVTIVVKRKKKIIRRNIISYCNKSLVG